MCPKNKKKHFIGIAESPGRLGLGNLKPLHKPAPYTQPAFSSVSTGIEKDHFLSIFSLFWRKKQASLGICHPWIVGTAIFITAWNSQKLWVQGYFSEPFSPDHASGTQSWGPSSQQTTIYQWKYTRNLFYDDAFKLDFSGIFFCLKSDFKSNMFLDLNMRLKD